MQSRLYPLEFGGAYLELGEHPLLVVLRKKLLQSDLNIAPIPHRQKRNGEREREKLKTQKLNSKIYVRVRVLTAL